jgi:ketosteroid isomerase-like protein
MAEQPTTSDVVELTRRLYRAANAGEMEAIPRFFHRDAVWDQPDAAVGTLEGAVAIRRFVEDWQGSYDAYEAEVEEILDVGNGVTFAISVQEGRLAGSSAHVRIRFAAVHAWTDGAITRMASYGDLDEGRVAAERLAESRG